MKLRYSLICDNAYLLDGVKPAFIGVFENISIPKTPFTLRQMYLILNYQIEDTDDKKSGYKTDVNLVRKDDNSITHAATVTMAREGKEPYIGLMLELLDTRFDKPGEYFFEIKIEGMSETTRVPLSVIEGNAENKN